MVTPDTTIIVPQRGHADLTRQCLESLRKTDATAWPVIVVDDGSPAGAGADFDIGASPSVQLITQPPRGVSASWNRGASAGETPYLLFLNNDTVSTGPWVERLVDPLRRGECVMTGAGMRIERAVSRFLKKRFLKCELLEGWCFAVSRQSFAKMAGFDESLRVYWSDTDFQLRLMIDSRELFARPLRAVTNLPLRHLGHRTAHDRRFLPQQRRQWHADRGVFMEKWERVENPKHEIRNSKQIQKTKSQ